LCFSDRIERIAAIYRRRRGLDALATPVEPFFKIPAPDESLSVVYANCLFDFCAVEDFDSMLLEVWRVLEPAGVLFAVHMAPPSSWGGRLWAWIFDRFTFLSNGCYPVSIRPHLTRTGYRILKDASAARLGFPARYSVSEKPTRAA
jgi:SAM-dependent methyltransferase